MKKIFFFVVCLYCISATLKAQSLSRETDSLVSKCLERYLMLSTRYFDDITASGSLLLLVSKKDSMTINSIYTSHKKLELTDEGKLQDKMNLKCKNEIDQLDHLMVPVYYYYPNDSPIPNDLSKIRQKIKKLRRRGYYLSNFPLTITISRGVR